MSHVEDVVCIVASKSVGINEKDFYHVPFLHAIHLFQLSWHIIPVSGCCNHAIATLYYLEDYVSSGLQEEEKKGCTERLHVCPAKSFWTPYR